MIKLNVKVIGTNIRVMYPWMSEVLIPITAILAVPLSMFTLRFRTAVPEQFFENKNHHHHWIDGTIYDGNPSCNHEITWTIRLSKVNGPNHFCDTGCITMIPGASWCSPSISLQQCGWVEFVGFTKAWVLDKNGITVICAGEIRLNNALEWPLMVKNVGLLQLKVLWMVDDDSESWLNDG